MNMNSYCYFCTFFISSRSLSPCLPVSLSLALRARFKQFCFQMTWKRMQERATLLWAIGFCSIDIFSVTLSLPPILWLLHKYGIYNLKERLHFIQSKLKQKEPPTAAVAISCELINCVENLYLIYLFISKERNVCVFPWRNKTIESSNVFNYNCTMYMALNLNLIQQTHSQICCRSLCWDVIIIVLSWLRSTFFTVQLLWISVCVWVYLPTASTF